MKQEQLDSRKAQLSDLLIYLVKITDSTLEESPVEDLVARYFQKQYEQADETDDFTLDGEDDEI